MQEEVFNSNGGHGENWGTVATINIPPPYVGPIWYVQHQG